MWGYTFYQSFGIVDNVERQGRSTSCGRAQWGFPIGAMLDLIKSGLPVLRVIVFLYGATMVGGLIFGVAYGRFPAGGFVDSLSGIPNYCEASIPFVGGLLQRSSGACKAMVEHGRELGSFWLVVLGVFSANFLVSGAVVLVRSSLVVPLALNLVGVLNAGAAASETILKVGSVGSALMAVLVLGLVLVEVLFFVPLVFGVVAAECWVLWPSAFGFGGRQGAWVAGLKLIGLCAVVMGAVCLLHAVVEATVLVYVAR